MKTVHTCLYYRHFEMKLFILHTKDYGLIAKTFLDSKLGNLFGMSWKKYMDENNQKRIRDPTSSQLKAILSDLQTGVCKKLSILSNKENVNHSSASNTKILSMQGLLFVTFFVRKLLITKMIQFLCNQQQLFDH